MEELKGVGSAELPAVGENVGIELPPEVGEYVGRYVFDVIDGEGA
jgi:hypothetical protein